MFLSEFAYHIYIYIAFTLAESFFFFFFLATTKSINKKSIELMSIVHEKSFINLSYFTCNYFFLSEITIFHYLLLFLAEQFRCNLAIGVSGRS